MTTGSGGLDAGGPAEAGAVISAITTAVTPQISASVAHVGLIGVAILLVVVAIVAFAWVRRVLTGDSGKSSSAKPGDTAASVRSEPVFDADEKYGPISRDEQGDIRRTSDFYNDSEEFAAFEHRYFDEEPMTASGYPE